MRRSCVYIGTTVDQEGYSLGCRDQRGKRRTFYTFASSDKYLSANQDSSGTSGRNECIGFLFFDHLESHYDRRIFLLADCKYRRLCGFNYFCGIDHLDPVLRIILIFLKFCLDDILHTCQDHLNIIPLFDCFHGCFYRFHRGVVATHGIYNYSNYFCHNFSSCCFCLCQITNLF